MQSAKDPGATPSTSAASSSSCGPSSSTTPPPRRSPSRSATRRCPPTSTTPRPTARPAPVMIVWNGLDSTKEMMVGCGIHQSSPPAASPRLMVDCPGAVRPFDSTDSPRRSTPRSGPPPASTGWRPEMMSHRPDRSRGLVPRRLLRAPGGRLREAPRPVRRLGRQPQLGGGAEASARPRGREPGPALLGPCPLGLGQARHRHVHRVRRGRPPRRRRRTDHGAVPHRARRERPADPPRVRPPVLRPGRQQPEARASDLHARGGSTEHIGLDHFPHVIGYIADWVSRHLPGARR